MIGYLSGRLVEGSGGNLLIAVGGEAGSVGYSVNVPQTAAYDALLPGEKIEVFVYTHVREDALDLYGFSTRREKDLFMTLLSVNGIGPKSALGILTNADSEDLIQAITDKDKAYLVRLPGVGKKTAEQMVLDLSDKIAKLFRPQAGASARPTAAAPVRVAGDDRAVFEDALAALLELGIREADATVLLQRALSGSPVKKVEDLVKVALKEMSHGVR